MRGTLVKFYDDTLVPIMHISSGLGLNRHLNTRFISEKKLKMKLLASVVATTFAVRKYRDFLLL